MPKWTQHRPATWMRLNPFAMSSLDAAKPLMTRLFDIGQEELCRIFDTLIAPALFAQAPRATDPLLILIGGQPGAGKTRAGREVALACGQSVVRVIGDNLRPYHPAFEDLLQLDPASMPRLTAQASGTWVEMAARYAAEHRVTALIEGTWRNPAVALGTARMFADRGFRVEAVAVAVSPEESHLSTATRFADDEIRDGIGRVRFTPVAEQCTAIDGIPATMRAMCEPGAPVDRMIVQTRDNVLTDQVRHEGRLLRGHLMALRTEQNRVLSDAEMVEWSARRDWAVEHLEQAHPSDEECQMLVRQLGYDAAYLEARRGGRVAVRGHARAGRDVVPYTRSRPASR